jgi:hypothetical protein
VTFEKLLKTHAVLVLNDGSKILLESLSQSLTYRSLLMGHPTPSVNDRLILEAEQRARKLFRAPTRVVPPVRTTKGPEREELPPVESLGFFVSTIPAGPQGRSGSALTFVWYSDEFGLPTAPDFFSAVLATDWRACAGEYAP